jgi:hypothetical protein
MLTTCLLGCNNSHSTHHGSSAEGGLIAGLDVGALAYEITHASLLASPVNGTARAAALEARRDAFVEAINTILSPDAVANVGPALDGLIRLVDDDTIPRMTRNIAAILQELADEPGRPTLRAALALRDARGPLRADDALELAIRFVNYPEITELFRAFARFISDGSGPGSRAGLVDLAEGLFSRWLNAAAQAPAGTPTPGLLDGISGELLAEVQLRNGVSFGAPAFAARVDTHENPAVAVDPATGLLYAPFIDANGDGAADVNASGQTVDAAGQPIDIPPFGDPAVPGRDAWGRALAPDGRPLYVTFDAKQTLLSHLVQLLGEALRRGMHMQALDAVEQALGARVQNDGGTPGDPSDDFLGFAPDSPVTDLAWGAISLLELDEFRGLFAALDRLQRQDPAFSEKVLVTYGRIVELTRPFSLRASGPPTAAGRARTDALIRMLDDLFHQGGGPSTGRLLLQVLHDLGTTARDLPDQLALLMEYRTLALDAQGNVDPSRSILVDHGRPATRPGTAAGENRSILHQLINLFDESDACNTFVIAGKPLSESLVELLAAFSPATLQQLVNFIDSGLVRGYVQLTCPAVLPSLDSVKSLAASGALRGFVPIARVFVGRGETRLFVELIKTVASSYDAVREIEPDLANVLHSGAIGPVFDLVDAMIAGRNGQPVADPVTGTRAIDLVADLLGKLLAHPRTGVPDRRGVRHPTRLHLLLAPLRRIEDAAASAPGGQASFTTLLLSLNDLFVERLSDDQLVNPNLTPFLARALGLVAQNLPRDLTARRVYVADMQQGVAGAVGSRDLAAIVDLLRGVGTGPGALATRAAFADLLTPDPNANADAFGSLMRIVAATMQSRVPSGSLRPLAAYGAKLFDPVQGRTADLVAGVAEVLATGDGLAVPALLRNGLNPTPISSALAGRSPAEALAEIADAIDPSAFAVSAPASSTPPTPDQDLLQLEGSLRDTAGWLRDGQEGLERMYEVIRNRGL